MNKKTKKILLVSILIIIIGGIFLYSFFGNNNMEEYMQYKNFFTELENGNIKTALIEDGKVEFTINNDEKTYYTDNPNYEGFKEKLLLNGVIVEENSAEENFSFAFDCC